jgi:hypothetical protein
MVLVKKGEKSILSSKPLNHLKIILAEMFLVWSLLNKHLVVTITRKIYKEPMEKKSSKKMQAWLNPN